MRHLHDAEVQGVLAALRAVDGGSLYFTPRGLAGPLEPAQAAHIFATWMAQLALADDVHDFDAADFLGTLVADGHLELTVDGAGPPTASACD